MFYLSSNPVWEHVRDRRHELFQAAFAYAARTSRFSLASDGRTELVDGLWVSGEYFNGLGVRPILGRTFAAEDDRRGGGSNGPVAVIGYGFWQRRFGGAADVIGRTLILERVPFTIVGSWGRDFLARMWERPSRWPCRWVPSR